MVESTATPALEINMALIKEFVVMTTRLTMRFGEAEVQKLMLLVHEHPQQLADLLENEKDIMKAAVFAVLTGKDEMDEELDRVYGKE